MRILIALIWIVAGVVTLFSAAIYREKNGGNRRQPDMMKAQRMSRPGETKCLWPHKVCGYWCWRLGAYGEILAGLYIAGQVDDPPGRAALVIGSVLLLIGILNKTDS